VLQERVALRRNRASRPEKGAIHEEENQEGRQENPQKGKIAIVAFAQGRENHAPAFLSRRSSRKTLILGITSAAACPSGRSSPRATSAFPPSPRYVADHPRKPERLRRDRMPR